MAAGIRTLYAYDFGENVHENNHGQDWWQSGRNKADMKKKIMAAVLMMSMVVGSSLTVCAAPEIMADGTVFDAEYYAQMYPDVVAELGTDTDALYQHYVTFGKMEGRLAVSPVTDSSVNVNHRLTDQEVINSYQWDLSAYCGGDKSANWVEVPFPAESWQGKRGDTFGCYDNLQWLLDLDTGTLFIYGNGALWPEGYFGGCTWSFDYPYIPSPSRDDSKVDIITKIDGKQYIYMNDLIHHVIFGEGVTSLYRFGSMFGTYHAQLEDVQILGKNMQPIRNNMFEGNMLLKYVSIPAEVQIIDIDGNPTDGFVKRTEFSASPSTKEYQPVPTIRN